MRAELDELEREGELPIEELLRLYNCPPSMAAPLTAKKPRKKRKPYADSDDAPPAPVGSPPPAATADDDESGPTQCKTARLQQSCTAELLLLPPAEDGDDAAAAAGDECEDGDDEGDLDDADLDEDTDDDGDEGEDDDGDDSEELEPDYEYYPDEADLKKCILIGDNHQADIPDVQPALQADAACTADQLLWSPHSEKVNDGAVERFLASFYKLRRALNAQQATPPQPVDGDAELVALSALSAAQQQLSGGGSGGGAASLKDEECALLQLLQADYNVEVALQQVCTLMQPNGAGLAPPCGAPETTNSLGYSGSSPVGTWSEEECRNFELGIRLHGKNFPLIRQTKVATRSVPELVQFYYIWKKTERYDAFAAKQRLEKKKYSSQNPGLMTEFMDKFLEEQQQRSLSPRQMPPGPVAGDASPPTERAVEEQHQQQQLQLREAGTGDGAAAAAKAGTEGSAEDSAVVADEGHSLLIYADSKRHRGSSVGQVTPPAVTDQRNPMEMAASKAAVEDS